MLEQKKTHSRAEILKKYGLTPESFKFYLKMGAVKETSAPDSFHIEEVMDTLFLEKKTVFRYCFDDSWRDGIRDFKNFVKYTGEVKRYTKEEIRELEKEMKRNAKSE